MRGKTLRLKSRFRGKKSSNSHNDGVGTGSKKTIGKKVRSKAAVAMGEHSDDDAYSDDSYSDVSEGEDEAFRQPQSNPRFQLQRTWSVNAMQISSHSAVYLDDSDSGSSSYEEFNSDDDNDDLYMTDDEEEDNETAKTTNETKDDKTRRTGKTSTKKKKVGSERKKSGRRPSENKYKKEKKHWDAAPEMIPEGDEDEEMEDMSGNESDDNSVSFYQTPNSLKKSPSNSEFSSDVRNFDSGYSSDSALVRKRMAMIQQQQEDERRKQDADQCSNEPKKKKGGKKKPSAKKKEKKKGNKSRTTLEKDISPQSGGASLEGDSTVTTISVESEEEVRQSHETKVDKNGKKKKKKKKKGKNTKDGKKKKRVISFVVDGDDDACEDFDKRLEEIEKFEAALMEERKLIQKERGDMAFERESMEMRLDEETQHCDELNIRIKELEQLVMSQKISNAGNDAESIDEKQIMKLDFAREKREFHLQLVQKEREIDDLKLTVRDLKTFQDGEDNSGKSNNMGDGKSRERLQGELLQTVAKLAVKEARLKSQGKELDIAREDLISLKDKVGGFSPQEDIMQIQQELENERKENAAKIKDKDETVGFLMNELARLKKEQSRR